ncbi:MAG TPA: zinc-binding dehydrogenase [Symbiobacteriaceae bacterium]|nr:zinc-binding dehydrogenase [Symbiobacteriaceae bacterium]
MRRAVLTAFRQFAIEEVPVPALGDRDVLIKVKTCGICTGELELFANAAFTGYPIRLGHEVAGEIAAVGPHVTEVSVGDYVAAINEREGFADFCLTAADRVVKLPPGLPLHEAVGEPIACAVNAARRINPDYQDTVVLVGAGFMGLLLQQCLLARSPKRVIAIDTRQEAVERAAAYGAHQALNAATEDVRQAVLAATGGQGADIVVEASGTQGGLTLAGDLVRIRGRLVIYGYHQGAPRQVNMQQWNWKGLDVINAHERDHRVYVAGLKAGLDLAAQGKVSIGEMITHRFPLSRINEAFAFAHDRPPGYVKATIDVEER